GMRLARRLVLLVIVAVLAYPAWLAYRVWDQSHHDEVHSADAIVVLGAAQYNGEPSPVLKARLDQATYLFEEGLARTVIVTGGKREGDAFTEAQASHMYLEEQGIPAEQIFEEEEGTTTLESLERVRDIAEDRDIETVLLVSDPLHSERIKRMAHDLGFEEAYASPASYVHLNRSRETKMKEIVREVGSLIVYQFLKR
ncbi:MAG TPA: YdcF family protein, partial [Actinomycetota bacterium]|nr:YdcF family protein [Actinomycetota bacterium]